MMICVRLEGLISADVEFSCLVAGMDAQKK